MLSSLLPLLYCFVVLFLLWRAFRFIGVGFSAAKGGVSTSELKDNHQNEDRTGQLTIHPELLDQDGRITNEKLLTVRFSKDIDQPPQSAETSAE